MKVLTVMKLLQLVLFLSFQPLAFAIPSRTNQVDFLRKLIKSLKSGNSYSSDSWGGVEAYSSSSPVYIGPQEGQMEADRIISLPGQPGGVDFNQYAGYVTVDPNTGKSLFYYFVESPQDSSTKPLVLWLNGGPGCSSLGYGAMEELGPFRVNSDGKTLYRNEYAWNNAANVLFLESPAGVGFSYSNTSSDYVTGDTETAVDSYIFLVNWLERFPQYKTRDFYVTGESYAGHYVPQLAYTIISNNKNSTNQTYINLKGIAIGNAYVDYISNTRGTYDYYWTHGLNSDETNAAINKYCDYVNGNFSGICDKYQSQGDKEIGHIDNYNIYAPLCDPSKEKPDSNGSVTVKDFDPCSDDYIYSYLNLAEVQTALHAKSKNWEPCGGVTYVERVRTVLPIIKQLIASGIRLWMYSGDTDSVVPITDTRYAINSLNLSIETAWRPWYTNREVGGYVVGYKGLTFVTVRGAGHEVPSYQPERSLTMISSFLQGELPPSS